MRSKDDIRKIIKSNYKAGVNAKDLIEKNLDGVKSVTVYNIHQKLREKETLRWKSGSIKINYSR